MTPVSRNRSPWSMVVGILVLVLGLPFQLLQAQSAATPAQSQSPTNSQSDQNIPDAPSTVQPPPPLPVPPPGAHPDPGTQTPAQDSSQSSQNPAPPRMPPVQTVAPGTQFPSAPRNQLEGIYKLPPVHVSFVQIPVLVKYSDGSRVDGLLPKDFTVLENGKAQTLTYFSSDPFELSVAIILDTGMPDVDLQKINQTYSSLVGAFSPYDEVALYTYSSTVSQVSDFTRRPEQLTAKLDEIKLVRGSNGPPVLNGPLASGPTINGAPPGGGVIAPVNTPEREFHVLNDAILRAALDLGKREKTRRKVIFVISDGRELGSQASYRDVLKVVQTRNIQIKSVVLDTAAVPGVRWVERKIRLPYQGYTDILPRYCKATGGGDPFYELSRNTIEEAYAQITSEVRDQYTLGYVPQATKGSSAYRSIEVVVHKKGLKVTAKDGYYPAGAGQ